MKGKLFGKTGEGGFINERYEKWNRAAGYVALAALAVGFVVLLWWAVSDAAGDMQGW